MNSIRAAAFLLFCGLLLGSFSPLGWAGEQASGSAHSAEPLLAQTTDIPVRPQPRPGTVPGARRVESGHGPAVIPEPPPFPDQGDDAMMVGAIAGISAMLLVVILLIVMMVRRDVAKKRLNAENLKAARSRRQEPGLGGHTISHTTGMSRVEDEPLTIIRTQWRDIQPTTGSGFPTISLIQADAEMQESVRAGYNPFYGAGSGAPTPGIEVVEVAHSLPDVEALIWMGLNEEATVVLEQLMVESEHPVPKIWLMLFDLYKRQDAEEKYTRLAQGFKSYFNAEVPPWYDRSVHAGKELEDYPAVINKVVRLWGQPICLSYLDTLLYDNRSGTRVGFSIAAYSSLVFLSDLIQTLKELDETRTEAVPKLS